MARFLELLPVPTGRAVLDLMPVLAAMMRGEGPALLPAPAGHSAETAALANALGAGTSLAPSEDNPHDPTALVIATSGSTGAAKGALLPVGALTASADATRSFLTGRNGRPPRRSNRTADQLAAGPAGNWLLALPVHHIAGMQVLLRSVAEGSEPTVLDVGRPFTAAGFRAAVEQMPGGRRFTSLVPTQLYRVLADQEATAALATFDAVLVGGAATSEWLRDQARRSGIPVVTTYGMSETCGGCVYDGVPLELVSASIRSGDEGTPGELWITGPMVALGYRGLPRHAAFGPPGPAVASGRAHRTFLTNDLATSDVSGIHIIGRVDDVIITGGVKIDPLVVESVLLRVSGVVDVVITSIPDPEWGQAVVAAVVPMPHSAGPDLAVLRQAASDALGPAAAPNHLLLLEEFPFRSIGKPDRRAIAELARRQLTGP